MATVVELLAKLRADSSQFTAEMERAAKATEKVQTSASETSSSLNNMAGVFKKVATGAVALYIGKLGMESVRAAQAASVAQDRLARILLTTGGATESQIKILNAHAAALAASTVVTESNITTVQSQLATFDLHGSTIAQLTPAILDYVVAEKGAGASADEFRQMTNGLAQALNGQFASLTAVGFVLDAETKAKIKSGTESERAIAITEVLNSTYKDFAKGSDSTVNAQVALGKQIEKLKESFGKALLPAVSGVQTFLANTFIPILDKVVIGFQGFISVLGSVASFVKKYEIAFAMLATAIITYIALTKAARIATALFGKVMGSIKKVQQAYAFWTYTATGATTGFAGALNFLKAAIMTNPIGFIVTALVAVGVGFKLAWDRSETFRKVVISVAKASLKAVGFIIRVVGFLAEAFMNIVTGPAKLFLKVLGFINPDAKKAYEGLKGMTNNVGKFFDDAAKKVEDYSKTLDKYAKITKKTKDGVAKNPEVDLSGLGISTTGAIVDPKAEKAAQTAAQKLVEMKRDLQVAVKEYSKYLKTDFANSFMDGADNARNAVAGALDKLEKVFEAKGKMLSGKALDNLRKGFDAVAKKVTAMGEQLAGVSAEIAAVSEKLAKATDNLEKALEERASAQAKFADLMATPFGEPSKIAQAMSSSEANVGSIIAMYDELIETVNQRFTELAPGARDAVKNFLTTQTQGLIDAARMRVKAIKVLETAQKRLDDLMEDQKQFSSGLTKSLKGFATAIADISNTDSKATYSVIKTATGMVITQLKKSSNGVTTITNQLKDRLKSITEFAANANKLLASGLNKNYVRQLLEAGPEAAGEAVKALASASAEQIAEINSLYGSIDTVADTFATDMSTKMLAEGIAMATAFRDGAALGVELITATMEDIVGKINGVLGVLGNTGLTSASALINALIAEFDRQAKETVGPATQKVVEKIKETLGTLAAVGTTNAQAFMDGLLGALTGKDNINNLNLSATAIKTNIDTVMKTLSSEGSANGLSLINSIIGALGGTNLVTLTNSATAVKDGVTTALTTLKTLGTEVATDLAQGMVDKLTAEKEKLVALAASIAAAISAEMAKAAASFDIEIPEFNAEDFMPKIDPKDLMPKIDPKDVAPKDVDPKNDFSDARDTHLGNLAKAAAAIQGKADDAANAAEPFQEKGTKTKTPFDYGNQHLKELEAAAKTVTKTAKVTKTPKIAPVPKVTKTPTKTALDNGNQHLKELTAMAAANKSAVTVNIATTKVTPTVTASTIANAIKNNVKTTKRVN